MNNTVMVQAVMMSQSILNNQSGILCNQNCSKDSDVTSVSESILNNQSGVRIVMLPVTVKCLGALTGVPAPPGTLTSLCQKPLFWGSGPTLRWRSLRIVRMLAGVPCQPPRVPARLISPRRWPRLSPPRKRQLRPLKGAVHANPNHVHVPFVKRQWLQGPVQTGWPHAVASISVGCC